MSFFSIGKRRCSPFVAIMKADKERGMIIKMRNVYLLGRSGVHANEKLLLEGELIIGRDPQMCQLIYPESEKKISGVHCKVQEINGNICVIDLNSTNGTFFQDGTRLIPDMPRTIIGGQGFYLGNRENFFDVVVEENTDSMWGKKQKATSVQNVQNVKSEAVSQAPAARQRTSAATPVLAILLIVVIAVGGVVGYHYYQEANKSTVEKIADDFIESDGMWDAITNLFE